MKTVLDRLGLRHGQFFAAYKAKNLNWWLDDRWIGFGDLRNEDLTRIQAALKPVEKFVAGWKELPPWSKKDDFFGDGGGNWVTITSDEIIGKMVGDMDPGQLSLFNDDRQELLDKLAEWETHHESDVKYRQAQRDRLARVREETGI